MGRPESTLSQIINGSKLVTTQTAKELAAAFGTSAELWMNLESAYRLALEEADASDVVRRAEIYAKAPLPTCCARGWIKQCRTLCSIDRRGIAISGHSFIGRVAAVWQQPRANRTTTRMRHLLAK